MKKTSLLYLIVFWFFLAGTAGSLLGHHDDKAFLLYFGFITWVGGLVSQMLAERGLEWARQRRLEG